MKKIEHIGIAVSNLEESNNIYTKILGLEPYKKEVVDSEGVITSFFQTENTKIELLQGLDENNAISKFIRKSRRGFMY